MGLNFVFKSRFGGREGHIRQAVLAFFELLWQADCTKARILSSESGGKVQGKQSSFYDPITQAGSSLKAAEGNHGRSCS